MAKESGKRASKLSVYLYIPNIIGYVRVIMNCVAFSKCLTNKKAFCILYFIRLRNIFCFVCDAVDGWCARKFNQGVNLGQNYPVSTFGAVLDMVTDRISTACLLVILSQLYQPGLIFVSLLALDIASHWLQMYSTFLSGKASHKDVKDSNNWLFRAYYGNRVFMAYCCVSCEVLYLILYLISEVEDNNLIHVLSSSAQKNALFLLLTSISVFGWSIKQFINVIQMKTAADVCVLHDINKKQKI